MPLVQLETACNCLSGNDELAPFCSSSTGVAAHKHAEQQPYVLFLGLEKLSLKLHVLLGHLCR